jgi:homospermidine synthase
MYLTTIKIKREGVKPVNEQYLVEAVNLTDVEVKVTRNFNDVITIISCKEIKFVEIFEGIGEVYFEVKVRTESIDDKKVTEVYIQEAETEPDARTLFGNNVTEGSIVSFVEKPYLGIIR